MTTAQFEQVLSHGESLTVEFKTWIHAKDMRERISLAVDELVAFANAKGGIVYMESKIMEKLLIIREEMYWRLKLRETEQPMLFRMGDA